METNIEKAYSAFKKCTRPKGEGDTRLQPYRQIITDALMLGYSYTQIHRFLQSQKVVCSYNTLITWVKKHVGRTPEEIAKNVAMNPGLAAGAMQQRNVTGSSDNFREMVPELRQHPPDAEIHDAITANHAPASGKAEDPEAKKQAEDAAKLARMKAKIATSFTKTPEELHREFFGKNNHHKE